MGRGVVTQASQPRVTGHEDRPRRGLQRLTATGRRWPVVATAIALALVKADGVAVMVHHRGALIVLVSVALVARAVRFRPVDVAALAGCLVALVIAPHPLIAGVGVAIAACAAIVTLLLLIAMGMEARDRRAARLGE